MEERSTEEANAFLYVEMQSQFPGYYQFFNIPHIKQNFIKSNQSKYPLGGL